MRTTRTSCSRTSPLLPAYTPHPTPHTTMTKGQKVPKTPESRRHFAKKQEKQEAKQRWLNPPAVIPKPWKADGYKPVRRRNPGRFDGMAYNADGYVCNIGEQEYLPSEYMASEDLDPHFEQVVWGWEMKAAENATSHITTQVSVVDLLATARRTRKRTKVRTEDFEVVKGAGQVIALDDDDLEYFGDDDWERVDDGEAKPSYSAVVQGKNG
ncbi:hypothetical protein JAAARDRAFT_79091 [Jaapia argillacea MUCL 33604]|uniref:Uncharacterized protein n=1 Tax=Jaapia argillacea MUCL 33604 TaxID=933084 RepID=A0A067PRQ7_9AGAM|nr:hypothetical protein JAAARDRAFT_79091 [Jaapia argillacea MUCL 33604]